MKTNHPKQILYWKIRLICNIIEIWRRTAFKLWNLGYSSHLCGMVNEFSHFLTSFKIFSYSLVFFFFLFQFGHSTIIGHWMCQTSCYSLKIIQQNVLKYFHEYSNNRTSKHPQAAHSIWPMRNFISKFPSPSSNEHAVSNDFGQ